MWVPAGIPRLQVRHSVQIFPQCSAQSNKTPLILRIIGGVLRFCSRFTCISCEVVEVQMPCFPLDVANKTVQAPGLYR